MGKRPGSLWFSIFFTFEQDKSIRGKGPVGKFFGEESLKEIMKICNASIGDSIFWHVARKDDLEKFYQEQELKIADDLKLVDKNLFAFCWIVDCNVRIG